jgi:hypothetical protein
MRHVRAIGCWLGARTLARAAACSLAMIAVLAVVAPASGADAVKGEARFAAADGYARLMLSLQEDVGSEVTVAGSVLVVGFRKPVDIAVEALSAAVPDYVGAARRDPDGTAIRLALSRKVRVNTMTAGERSVIDLLPESWGGPPPALPQEGVRELAERARAAEAALRRLRAVDDTRKHPPVRVRASLQPTFVRFTFELPGRMGVSTSLKEGQYAVMFETAMTFDLSEARAIAPAQVAAIEQTTDGHASSVNFKLLGDVDARSFREDGNYVVDITFKQIEPPSPAVAIPVKPEAAAKVAAAAQPDPAGKTAAPGSAPATVPPPVAPPFAARPETVPAAAVKPIPAARPASGVSVTRDGEGWRLRFAFAEATAAAAFQRGDTLWLVFDASAALDLEAIRRDAVSVVAAVTAAATEDATAQVVRMRFARPQLASLTADGTAWTLTLGNVRAAPSQPLAAVRHLSDPTRANIMVRLSAPGPVRRLVDPDNGEALVVVTAPAPARGIVKAQRFIEFALLETIHGVAVQPFADDVAVTAEADGVAVSRPGGLIVSPAVATPERASVARPALFDPQGWQHNRDGAFITRRDALIDALAQAEAPRRLAARLALARFYVARGLFLEAKGVLDLALADATPGKEDAMALALRGVANILAARPTQGLQDLASPILGGGRDFELWKALALAQQGNWVEAREKFKNAEFAMTALPVELQRIALPLAMRAALEVKDYAGAAARSSDLDSIGTDAAQQPTVAVLRGRLAEALGHEDEALHHYTLAAGADDRPAATEARLFALALRERRGEVTPEETLSELETLAVTWRGDTIEVRTLSMLAKLYARANRYRDMLVAARTATRLAPDSELARAMQDEAAALFVEVFRDGKGDDLTPVQALALFYEFQELTPIGRRGDEIIRKLAGRLVAVDLLDQASELLQYQIDHRLEGAGRAQVATRLAMIHLMNRKPERAISALHATRIGDLAGELREQRILLEARAQSDIGRHDFALDLISNLEGREVVRLRSDIYWAARRWREAAEQIELLYGERWREPTPLTADEKADILRAAVGYALAQDTLGLGRFKDKYAAKMSGPQDRAAFEVAMKPASGSVAAFSQLAKMAASVDTINGFLRDMKTRFADTLAQAPAPREAVAPDPAPTGALPRIVGVKHADGAR